MSTNDVYLKKLNDFESICNNDREKTANLTDFLKVTQNGKTSVYSGNGNKLSYDTHQDYLDEIMLRT